MAKQIKTHKPEEPFQYQLVAKGDPDQLRTVVATPTQTMPLIDSSSLKLKHRIGRGPFGDVWLATHHQSAYDFDENHEVAVKMLHMLKEEATRTFVNKFEEIFLKCRLLQNICWLHGLSVINGKICVAMRFYEGSVSDRLAMLKGGKLSLSDVLRYGAHLAKGISELHSIGLLVLNVKPSNFLLDEHNRLVLGDFGIPYLLLGLPLSEPDMHLRLGTPNYMAPEQWEPKVRGPVLSETDAWGFGCSIIEMLTGVQPWSGKSAEEIYQSVVVKREKPSVSGNLPRPLKHVIEGCFKYDPRDRPLMTDILHAFESSLDPVPGDGADIGSQTQAVRSSGVTHTSGFLLKDRLQEGDIVRSKKRQNSGQHQAIDVPEGTVVGIEHEGELNSLVLVKLAGIRNPVRVLESSLERIISGFAVGDWVRLKEETKNHSPVGILHSVQRDGRVAVGFLGLETVWRGNFSQIQLATAYSVGQFVRLKPNILSPRFNWPQKRRGGTWATGRILEYRSNGCLVVDFPGRFVFGKEAKRFLADPAEVENVSFDTCPGLMEKYQHLEDFHWAITPLAIAFGLFTFMKLGVSVGGRKMKKEKKNNQVAGNGGWLPQPVANMIFRDGVSARTGR